MSRTIRRLVVAHVGLLLAASCGLLDLASINGVTFKLPPKAYSFDTRDPKWKQPPPGTGVPNVPCGAGQFVTDCCMPAGMSINCTMYPLVCDAGSCAMKFPYETAITIDLSKEVPDLQKSGGMILTDVLLKTIEIDITNNLNVSTPPVDLYVAPAGVTTASDARAKKLGTVPPKAAAFTGKETIELSPEAQQAFSTFAKDFKSPFVFLASMVVVVRGNTAAPSGKVDLSLSGTVEAKF